MSTIPTGRGTSVRSMILLLASSARRVLWTCVGALVARPLHVTAQPLPIPTRGVSRRTMGRPGDGT
jgi:hypothetical protein